MDPDHAGRALRSATSVEPRAPERFSAFLSPIYTDVGHPNGGYLQCVLANGALAAASASGSSHLHVTSMATNFVSALRVGAVEIRTQVRRVGRGASFVHASLYQENELASESVVTLGTLSESSTTLYQDCPPPEVAPLEECRRSTGGDAMNIMRVVDLRLDPSCARWSKGEYSPRAEVLGWLRLDDGESDWSPISLLFAGDVLPPAPFALGSSGWVPTLQLTSSVARVPTGQWLRARQWASVMADGFLHQRCELFDEAGELVSASSQIALVRFPSGL